jgi:hypothetical protein
MSKHAIRTISRIYVGREGEYTKLAKMYQKLFTCILLGRPAQVCHSPGSSFAFN